MSRKTLTYRTRGALGSVGVLAAVFVVYFTYAHFYPGTSTYTKGLAEASEGAQPQVEGQSTSSQPVPLDKESYDEKLLELANLPPVSTSTATSTRRISKWPVKAEYPLDGAVLPFNRIVAYYGNFYSTKMGVLGEYPPDVVVEKLKGEMKSWQEADPKTPVIPAVHYIATVAQGSAGADGDYTARMPDSEIQKAIDLARSIHGIAFLDIQIGQSTLMREFDAILPYMKNPDVHLGIDPEFAMQGNRKPGDYIGTIDAAQINEVIQALSKVVDDNNLPPKVLIVHRFTEDMVTHAYLIHPTKEVQVVMSMDGWGTQQLKTGIYRQVITNEPVQFAGIKLFYKNDLKPPSKGMLTPARILRFTPQPSYIQYQ